MNKIPLVASVAFGLIYPILAAEIYVDSASSAQSPDGSVDSPYKTIAAAVTAANSIYELKEETSVINIKGGEHVIAAADDLISVTASNLTIQAWAGTGTPKIVLDSELSVQSENPSIITVQSTALDCTIKGLEFQYFINNTKSLAGNSLGEKGRIIDVYAGRCSVDGCKFHQNNISTVAWGLHNDGIVSSRGEEKDHKSVGYELCVKNCYFSKVGRHKGRAIRSGTDAKIISNIFDDCAGYFYPIKQSIGGHFISNRVVNARASIFSNGQNYNEYNNMEIAYNIFVNATSEPFFQKSSAGMNSVKIHHNTIVGGRAFVATCNAGKFQWTPSFYNNLIILPNSENVVIAEEAANVGDVNPTTFKKGSVFKDNVWLAKDFNGGSAPLNLSQYKLIADSVDSVGLYVDNNRQISISPEFLETEDVFSDDFYRLNLTRYPWAAGLNSSQDTIPAYVGAVEPKAIESAEGEYFQIDSFTVEYDSLFAPVSATFTVGYSHNAGEVEVSWDFDGDGQYDQTGVERSVSYVYEKPGVYFPSVRVKDKGTGKILTMPLVSDAIIVSLENVYVDALADNGGDGSKEKPFRTIREGVAVCGENGVVSVMGGDDRVYNIVTADDLVQFNVGNVLLTQEEGFGRVKVNIDPSLNANTNNPSVITIAEDVNHVTITGFDFTYYGNDNGEYADQSLGNKGRVIDVYGDYATVSNCVFVQEGKIKSPSRGEVGHCAVATRATKDVVDTREKYGLYLKVIDCRFEGRTPGYDMTTIMCGKDTEIINNVFTNCYWMYYPVKQLTSDFTFVSNRMVNCRSMYSNSGGYNELPNAEIAYNTFITEFGEPFLTKEYDGLHEDVFIHHNTVVGSTNFVRVARNVRTPWRPKIYDNLIALSAGSALFQEDETEFYKNDGKVSASSSFKTDGGAAFTNNVYMADNFVAGKALSLEGYDLSKGLKVENNTVLSAAPRFMSTDMNSPDFMRLKAKKGDYPFSAAAGGYPNYVGAQEPMLRLDGMRIIIR